MTKRKPRYNKIAHTTLTTIILLALFKAAEAAARSGVAG